MGVRIASRFSGKHTAALFCSTEGIAFGPVFSSNDAAEDFLAWLNTNGYAIAGHGTVADARVLHNHGVLQKAIDAWCQDVEDGEWEAQ